MGIFCSHISYTHCGAYMSILTLATITRWLCSTACFRSNRSEKTTLANERAFDTNVLQMLYFIAYIVFYHDIIKSWGSPTYITLRYLIQNYDTHYNLFFSNMHISTTYVNLMSFQCWSSVCDAGPTLKRHWVNDNQRSEWHSIEWHMPPRSLTIYYAMSLHNIILS